MASWTFVAPNTASQPRANRFSEEVWELHKPDLVREYRHGGIATVLRWTKEQTNSTFSPTRKQLDHRLKNIWHVAGSSTDSTSTHDRSTTSPNLMVIVEHNGDTDGLKLQHPSQLPLTPPSIASEDSEGHDDSKSAQLASNMEFITNKLYRTGKRKASSRLTIKAGEEVTKKLKGLQESQKNGPQSGERTSLLSPISPSLVENTPNLQPILHPDWPSPTMLLEPQLGIPTECQNMITDKSEASDLPEITMTPDLQPNGATASPETDLRLTPTVPSFLQFYSLEPSSQEPSHSVVLDTSKSENENSFEEIKAAKNVAEFLFCCSLFRDAFPLYQRLWERSNSLQPMSEESLGALIDCARCAITDYDLHLVAYAVKERLARGGAKLDTSVLRVLELAIRGKRGVRITLEDIAAVDAVLPSAEDFDTNIDQGNRLLSLLTHWYLSLGLSFRQANFPSSWDMVKSGLHGSTLLGQPTQQIRICQVHFLHYIVSTPVLNNGVKWCLFEIGQARNFQPHWRTLRKHSLDPKRSGSIVLFLFLWSRWNSLDGQFERVLPGFRADLFGDVHKFLGISLAEFLKAMAFEIMEEGFNEMESRSSRPTKFKIPRYLWDKEEDVLTQAQAGATALSKLPNRTVAEKFLDNYMRINFDNIWEMTITQPSEVYLHREGTIDFMLDTLGITLRESGLPGLGSPGSTNHHSQIPDRGSRTSEISLGPRWAPSLSSSSLSSFRKLALDISRRSRMSASSWRNSIWTQNTVTNDEIDRMSDTMGSMILSADSPTTGESRSDSPMFDQAFNSRPYSTTSELLQKSSPEILTRDSMSAVTF